MCFGHLYAPFEIGLGESTVVRRGQGGEEEGQEDDDLKVTVILTFQKDFNLKVEVILACSRNWKPGHFFRSGHEWS